MPAYHLPYLAAAADGLFARHGLEVEILEPAPGPENVRRVALGGSDACLTSVAHYLTARARYGSLAARFAAVVVRRHPICGIVADRSSLREPGDLAGRRVGGRQSNGLVLDYLAALEHLGVGAPVLVPMDYSEAPAALGRGDTDVVADFIDLVPRTRRQAGVAVRGVRLGVDVYASGLVVADRVAPDVVDRLRHGVREALTRQRLHPEVGLADFVAEHPDVAPDDVVEAWDLGVPGIFTGAPVGDMDAAGWERTLRFTSAAHRLDMPAPETVYRPENLSSAGG